MPYLRCVKYLFDLQDVGDVPGVLGEGTQRQGIFPDKSCEQESQLLQNKQGFATAYRKIFQEKVEVSLKDHARTWRSKTTDGKNRNFKKLFCNSAALCPGEMNFKSQC